jgi:hypothetical protein
MSTMRHCASRPAVLITAAVMTAALAGCASSGNVSPPGGAATLAHGEDGAVRGEASLSGRVPYSGRSFRVGAISDGKIVQTAGISRTGGSFTFHLPAGSYRLSLLIPGVSLADSSAGCTGSVTSVEGRTVSATLQCEWH